MLSYFRDHAASPHLPYPPLFSLTISKNQLKKTAGTSHKKVFRVKTSACRDEKPAKQDGNDTTTHSHHPYILCHFANYIVLLAHDCDSFSVCYTEYGGAFWRGIKYA